MVLLFAAEVQAIGNAEVALVVALAQVREQTAALSDQLEKSTAAGLILLVVPQMLGELLNAVGQDGDLNFR